MKMQNEEQLLDKDFRKRVIAEIEGEENQKRKYNMKKRYDVFKDSSKEYVIEAMTEESQDKKIALEIKNRASNISFARKIIDKKAMVYKDGVLRKTDKDQDALDAIVDITNFNSKMKKTNKYAELFRNAVVNILPYLDPYENKYSYVVKVLQPYLYDVIEDQVNPEIARAYVTSYFVNNDSTLSYADENRDGYRENVGGVRKKSDGKDQIIADSPQDFGSNKKEYVWWSNRYHFTTDNKGEIIDGKQEEDLKNPIEILPFYNFSQDQDGQFWALGGDDIIDGSILLNILLTDLFFIAKYQGQGIGYLFGKGVPKNMKVGASSFITLDVDDGDPTPQLGFATSNPPISSHLEMIKVYLAFLLSTNNLEPSSIQGQLTASNAASGIQEIIKRSENMDDIVDQQEAYRDGEPVLFKIIARWHNLYQSRKLLIEKLQKLGKIDESQIISVKFTDPQVFTSEKEKLEIIEKRLSLGLDSMLDAVMKDNPDLSEDEAKEKLKKMLEAKLLETSQKMKAFAMNPIQNNEEEGDEEEVIENGEQDDIQA